MLRFCWKNHQRFCPRCRQRKLYKLAQGRRRCSRCGYTFHDFSGRYANVGQFSCAQWLWLVKLFELETPPKVLAEQMAVAQNTADKGVRVLRRAIMAHALDAALYARTGLLGGASQDAPPVFGILERGGWAFVDLMQEMSVEALAHFRNNFHLQTVTRGRLVYTDRYRHYDTLVFYAGDGLLLAPFKGQGRTRAAKGVYVDGKQGFWSYVRERLRRGRGVGARYFPFYLKELEFRYNHRQEDIFPLLVRFLCSFVPDHE